MLKAMSRKECVDYMEFVISHTDGRNFGGPEPRIVIYKSARKKEVKDF